MAKNELDGFVIFRANRSGYDMSVGLIICNTGMRLTDGAFRQCGSPEYVNVFFDEAGKRMMLKKAEKNMANVYKLSGKYITSTTVRTHMLYIAEASAERGASLRIEGHNPGAPNTIIFDLSKCQVLK